MKVLTWAVLISVSLTLFMARVMAEPPNIGSSAPDWGALEGVDDNRHPMSSMANADVLVVCFTSNTCPYSLDYEKRLVDLQDRFAKLKVRVVAINSNAIEADSLEKMTERAKDAEFNFPYLKDPEQAAARAYGAIYTPEFFVLNRKRELVYKGAMDDNTNSKKVTTRYVELAVEASLRGSVPKITSTGARGCAIRFPRRRRASEK